MGMPPSASPVIDGALSVLGSASSVLSSTAGFQAGLADAGVRTATSSTTGIPIDGVVDTVGGVKPTDRRRTGGSSIAGLPDALGAADSVDSVEYDVSQPDVHGSPDAEGGGAADTGAV
jgi:hypothetical protein